MSELIQDGIYASLILILLAWYLKIRLSSIKVKGICKSCSYGYKGYMCLFEYEAEGICLSNYEKKTHFLKCKEGKEYTLYVRKNNLNYVVSGKFMGDLIFWMSVLGILDLITFSLHIYDLLR